MKRSKKANTFYRILSIALAISSAIFLILLLYVDLLPSKYFKTILIVVLVFDVFNIFFIGLKRLKKKVKKFLATFMIIGTILFSIIDFYSLKTLNILSSNGDSKYKMANYSVIVLNKSSYKKIGNLKGKTIGYFENSEAIEDAKQKVEKEVKATLEGYKSSDELVDQLMDSKVDAILIEDSIKSILEEEIDGFKDSTRTIYTFKIKIKSETTAKEVNVTEKPFAIYISGIDTYGEISSVSRSDVNIVMVVNPNTHQVLLISIPRDYHVKLHGTTGYKDKLTHAGIYGVDMSIKTIEDLLDLDINYYIKVNFTSVIDIVDALGGLNVYSEYTFISYSGYSFKKGMNSVDGEEALDFARTRHAFEEGDRQRGKNQQAVIEALIRKLTSKSVITKYNSLLNAINGKYQTNMGMKKITSLIKMQLNDMPSWTVNSYSLAGYDSMDYVYTGNQRLYVMKPDEDSILEAKELIKSILNDEELEDSYTNIGGNSNNVTRPYNSEDEYYESLKPKVVKEEVKEEIEEEDEEEDNTELENKEDDETESEESEGENIEEDD